MKLLKIAVAAALAFGFGNAYAFHSGGVAECAGCHSMHNSFEGSANVTGRAYGTGSGAYLLKARDQSGACLNCHEDVAGSYHISTFQTAIAPLDTTVPVQRTPGGDFAWLKKTMVGAIRGVATTWEGDRHGHNIIAIDYGYSQDKVQTVAPGGTYPASALACSSCHDPHGRYRVTDLGVESTTGLPIFGSGSYVSSRSTNATQGGPLYPIAGQSAAGVYRILGGVGYQPASLTGSFAFTAETPAALSPSSYNSNQTTMAGVGDRVAYGRGMSEWCANCHGGMHQDGYTSGTAGLVHPAGNGAALTNAIAANYSAYVSSGVMTGTGAQYSAIAPFEVGIATKSNADYATLRTFQATPVAPTNANNVACISCHRAHASGFESMTRYYLGNEFMTVADTAGVALYDSSTTENKINAGYSVAQQTAAYNGRPATLFGPYARNYCNKCHAKD